jgi:hypothetical protein
MPTATYTALANITLGSAAATVTFSSIPATYRDLVLVFNGTRTGNNNVYFRVNGDTGSNYTGVLAGGNGSTTSSNTTSGTEWLLAYVGLDVDVSIMAVLNFMDYSATDKHKTALARMNQPATHTVMSAHRWANNAAINQITILAGNNGYGAGSNFALYGIAS